MKFDMHLPAKPDLRSIKKTSSRPVTKKDIVYKKHFRYPYCDISLRLFCIKTDMPVICNWVWKTSNAADLIAASYRYTSESNFARSYMAVIDGSIPFCEIDICHASQDELCDHFRTENGDYILRLLPSAKVNSRPLLANLLHTCTEYFFSFPEIDKIYVEGDAENTRFNQLLVKAGFGFQQKIYQSYKTSNLYYCTRDSFSKKPRP